MELNSQKRQTIGKAVKSLREEGLIPAVVFGNQIEPTSLVVNRNEFVKVFDKAGETGLVDLKVEKDVYRVLIKDVQYNAITGKVMHAGFYKPNLLVKTEVQVPVELIGEEENPLVKSGAGVLLQLLQEITVKALPTDLPDAFNVDVTGLTEIGMGVKVSELNFDHSKVELQDLELDDFVVKMDAAGMPEEEETTVTEADAIAAMEATAEKKPEDEEEETTEKSKK